MRDPKRIPTVLERLREAWELSPDLRLAQLLSAIEGTGKDQFYIEDDVWLELIDKFIKNHGEAEVDIDFSDSKIKEIWDTIQEMFGDPPK